MFRGVRDGGGREQENVHAKSGSIVRSTVRANGVAARRSRSSAATRVYVQVTAGRKALRGAQTLRKENVQKA